MLQDVPLLCYSTATSNENDRLSTINFHATDKNGHIRHLLSFHTIEGVVMKIWLPLWILRRLARSNPWLLSQSGEVKRSLSIPVLGLGTLEVRGAMSLSEKQRQRLLSEQDR